MLFGKPKLPVTETDKEWTELAFRWIEGEFGESFLKNVEIKTPTKKHFPIEYSGSEKDAEKYLEIVCEYMDIDSRKIFLNFYSEQPHELYDGMRTSLSEGLQETYEGSAGLYSRSGLGEKEISIEVSALSNPIALISTIAHELSHEKLLGEGRMEENNEPLTDLLAVAYGFGIFLGNSVFHFSQWQSGGYQGWETSRKGYLPEQMIAYSLALMVNYQGTRDLAWTKYLNKSMATYFKKSLKYIDRFPDEITFK